MAPQLSVIHDAANERKQRKANPQPRLTDTRALVPTAFRFSQALKGDTQCLKRSPHLRTAPARTLRGAVAPGSRRLPWEPVTAAGPTAGGRPPSTFSEPRGTSRGWQAPRGGPSSPLGWASLSAGWWQEAAGTGGAAPPLARLSVPRLPAHGTSQGVTGRHGAAQDVTGHHRTSQGVRGGTGRQGRLGASRGGTREAATLASAQTLPVPRAGGPTAPRSVGVARAWGRRGPGRMSGCSRRKQRADGRRVTSPRKADAAPRSRALHSRLLDAGLDPPGSPGPRRLDPARGVRSPPTHASKHDPQAQGQRPTRKQTGLRLTLTDLELTFKLLGDQKNKIFILNLSRLMR